jgi:antirestriction protein ArdC
MLGKDAAATSYLCRVNGDIRPAFKDNDQPCPQVRPKVDQIDAAPPTPTRTGYRYDYCFTASAAAALLAAEAQASTLLHSALDWTQSRLDRDFEKSNRFRDAAYAAEELFAELGAASLCATLGVPAEGRPDHAAYGQSWIKVLKNDRRFIFTAAGATQRAADWRHEKQGTKVVIEDESEAA